MLGVLVGVTQSKPHKRRAKKLQIPSAARSSAAGKPIKRVSACQVGGRARAVGRRYRCSMADDGDGRSTAADTSGGQGTTEELDPGAGLGISGMLLNLSVLVLVLAACYAIYARWWRRAGADSGRSSEASQLPKMRRRDFTLQQLGEYDGVQNPRILMAVNTKVFDVTSGKKFYGRGKWLALRGVV